MERNRLILGFNKPWNWFGSMWIA